MIKGICTGNIAIDCKNPEKTCDFYACILGLKKQIIYNCPAVIFDNGLTMIFMQCDFEYIPPVWPEEPGEQQKQMHFDFKVDDLNSTVEEAVKLGAVKSAEQYGGENLVTLFDPEGHPFCLGKKSENKSEFDLYFEEKGYGVIPDVSINIDCNKQKTLREFYAKLTGWDEGFHWSALISDNKMIVCFQGCDNDATMDEHIPPVWPEEPGKQQKQMHFDFQVDDLNSAVEEAIKLGAVKPAEQYGGKYFVTLFDTSGHPFCLCAKEN